MCGFAGFIDYGASSSEAVLHSMTNSLVHRGPDDIGFELFNLSSAKVGMGFRRLSIIDLSAAGHQPMHSMCKRYTITFNGEVYNFQEIKNELLRLGVTFRSETDTEVILNAFIAWGADCVHRFNGMFAIAILDTLKEEVHLFRDRAGVKPLFYFQSSSLLLFASELKAFHHHPAFKKEMNTAALALYFQHGYISAPHTIFKNTYKVFPGEHIVIQLNNKELKHSRYWKAVDHFSKTIDISYEEAKKETEKLLHSAFDYRMISDVPVGVFLSGGIDSSLVTALLQKDRTTKLNTFTIGFKEAEFNEADYAKKVAQHLGTNHNEYFCSYKEALDIIPQLSDYYDEPFADSSAIPTILVSRFAKQQVTVALSADGGDELFAGYTKYQKVLNYIQKLQSYPRLLRNVSAHLLHVLPNASILNQDKIEKLALLLASSNPVEAFNIITQGLTHKEANRLLRHPVHPLKTPFDDNDAFEKQAPLLNRFLCTDFNTFLVDDVLQKVDRATMSTSLEGREPFLDYRLIEFAAGLPSEYKITKDQGKSILKDILENYLPSEIINRPKMGFNIPIDTWGKHELKKIFDSVFNKNFLEKQTIINPNEALNIYTAYIKGHKIDFERLWRLFIFFLWYKKWIKS